MKIAIIGAGNVGTALGGGWQKKGHEVVYGVRDAASAKVSGMASRLAPPELAARDADVVVLTVPYGALQEVVGTLGSLDGKVVFDCTNPVGKGFVSAAPAGSSAAQQVAEWAKGARVVKVFNTTGFNIMLDPKFGNEAASMFFCGDDTSAKQTAAALVSDLGFEPVDAGPLKQARLLEQLALLWISMAMAHGHGRDMAFRLLKR
jgi:predicted dinucleotide-binding enzyme